MPYPLSNVVGPLDPMTDDRDAGCDRDAGYDQGIFWHDTIHV